MWPNPQETANLAHFKYCTKKFRGCNPPTKILEKRFVAEFTFGKVLSLSFSKGDREVEIFLVSAFKELFWENG